MLKLIDKAEYWAAEDAGMLKHAIFDPSHFQIKNIQDALLLHRLRHVTGQDIAEVGGGHSRVLGYFCKSNRCTNIDPLEGQHGGPAGQKADVPYRQVFATIGDSREVLQDGSFDLVFSISVVEHVPTQKLDAFFADLARILRAGGRMVHCIDTYLGVDPDINEEPKARFRAYRRVFETGAFTPFDPAQVMDESEVCFHPRMASNPDNIMNEWNHAAPALRHIREKAQACSFIMDGIRT
jgi:SAM-dependent methyltransferase